ncbi:MAG: response regulator transcription factor [Anaerolineae bacterium]|nr:response regulator transcription factor [Anaerolineae bacterium]
MKILIAEDDLVSRHLLQVKLRQWGYDVVETKDGQEAWQALQQEDSPQLAILDWMMPGMDGIDICRNARASTRLQSIYFIMLTTRNNQEDIIVGLQAGADDYITKPFESQELQARVQVGVRIVRLQSELAARVSDLEAALDKVKQLEGIMPICSYCKKIRDDKNYWQQIEEYITEHSEATFSHGICPDCYDKYIKPELDELKASRGK